MVPINSIMTTHVNKTTDQPSMSAMATKRYKNVDEVYLRGRY
jgi:hypothetical protein